MKNIEKVKFTKEGYRVKLLEKVPGHIFGRVIGDLDDDWRPAMWDEFGTCEAIGGEPEVRTNKYHNYDVELADWRDSIPWGALAEKIQWVVKSRNSAWYGAAFEPFFNPPIWQNHGNAFFHLNAVEMPQGPDDFKESKAKRPQHMNTK